MLTTRVPRFLVFDSVKVVYILTGLPPVFLEGSCSACHHKGMYVGHVSAAPLCVYGMLVQPLYLQTILIRCTGVNKLGDAVCSYSRDGGSSLSCIPRVAGGNVKQQSRMVELQKPFPVQQQ